MLNVRRRHNSGMLWVALWMPMLFVGCKDAPTTDPAPTGRPPTPASKGAAPAAASKPKSAAPATAAADAPREPFKRSPGVEACEDCHPEIVESYLTTGMGRSLYHPKKAQIIENFEPKAATIKHAHTGLEYQAYVDDEGRWWQEERLPGTDYVRRMEVAYVVGSGNHTRSYLGWAGDQMVEMPLTWYAHRKIWDMSPGYERPETLRFTRWVRPECMFCHNDISPTVRGAPAAYEMPLPEGISCVRCHGDATAHIASREAGQEPPAGEPDPTIVNPKHLTPDHQLQICQQCHLQGEARVMAPGKTFHEYSPERPLEEFMSIFEAARAGGGAFSIASHGHRMSLSACAQGSAKSDKPLVCTTCHDPHKPASTSSHREACLTCHTPKDCGDAHGSAADANCAGCHMRKGGTSDIPHVHFTDHFIRKRPTADEDPPKPDGRLADALSADKRAEKDPLTLGLAYGQGWKVLGRKPNRGPARKLLMEAYEAGRYTFESLHLLALFDRFQTTFFEQMEREEAKTFWPHPFWRLDWSDRLIRMGQMEKAIEVLKPGLSAPGAPARLWRRYADLLHQAGRHDEAEAAYAEAEKRNPYEPLLAQNRATNHMMAGHPDKARHWLEIAASRDGLNVNARAYLAELLIQAGDEHEALLKLSTEIKAAQPNDPRWRILKAEGLRISGKSKEALSVLWELPPTQHNARYWLSLARAHRDAGETEAARQAVSQGLRLGPENPALRALQQSL